MEAGEREENKHAGNDGKERDFPSSDRSRRVNCFFFNLCIFVLEYPTGASAKDGGLGRVIAELTKVKIICTFIIPQTIMTLSKCFTLPLMSKLLSQSAIFEDSTSKPTVIKKSISLSVFRKVVLVLPVITVVLFYILSCSHWNLHLYYI